MRIAIEAGTHSPWASKVLEGYGHEIFVANARRVRLIYSNKRKTDEVDAQPGTPSTSGSRDRIRSSHGTSSQGPPKVVERKVAVVVPHVLMLLSAVFVLLVLRPPVLHVPTVGGEQI